MIIWNILSGLKELAKKRVIHRDLKPENIIITEDAFIKIVDFGIARILEDNITRATQSGAFQTKEKLFLILDYCPGGDLARVLSRETKKRFSEERAKMYIAEIILAI